MSPRKSPYVSSEARRTRTRSDFESGFPPTLDFKHSPWAIRQCMVTIEEDVKVVKVGNSIRIAIPAVFSKALGIIEGDTVHLESTDHEILVRKSEPLRTGVSKKKG